MSAHLVDTVRRAEARLRARGQFIALRGPNCLCNPQRSGLCGSCGG